MWKNAYLSIKNLKASRALKWALDPHHKLLTSLACLHFATFGLRTWPPLDQILDPHLKGERMGVKSRKIVRETINKP